MKPVRRNRTRFTAALAAVSLALLLQSLAPPGYMAGSLDDGWPVVLCPEGLPAGFLGHQGHHHHEKDGGDDRSLGGYCPLGGMLDVSTGLESPDLDSNQTAYASYLLLYRAPLPFRKGESHPARAPPLHA